MGILAASLLPLAEDENGGRAGSEGRGEKGGGKEKETPLAQTDHYLLARAARTSLRISPFCHTSVLGSACTRYPSDTIAPLLSSSHLFRGCQCQKYAHMKGFSFTPSPPNPPPPFFFLFFFRAARRKKGVGGGSRDP